MPGRIGSEHSWIDRWTVVHFLGGAFLGPVLLGLVLALVLVLTVSTGRLGAPDLWLGLYAVAGECFLAFVGIRLGRWRAIRSSAVIGACAAMAAVAARFLVTPGAGEPLALIPGGLGAAAVLFLGGGFYAGRRFGRRVPADRCV